MGFLIMLSFMIFLAIILIFGEEIAEIVDKGPKKTICPTEKDPDDNSQKGSCTEWELIEYCNTCYGGIKSRHILNHWCPMCGSRIDYFGENGYGQYSHRKIYHNGSWRHQYKNLKGSCTSHIRDIPLERHG